MNHKCIAFALILGAILGAPGRGAALPKAPDAAALSADAVERAKVFFNQGVRLYSDKKWREAEAAFRAAWALNQTFDVAYNLGSAEYQLSKYPEAAEHLAFSLRHFPLIGAVASLRATAGKRLNEARAMIGTLTLKVNVRGADVLVDGKPVGKTPLERDVFVAPGQHTVEVRLGGYETASRNVQAERGSVELLDLVLMAALPAANDMPPKAAKPVQQTKISVPSKGSPAPIDSSAGSRSAVPAIVLGSVAAVGLAGGIAFTVASNKERSESYRLQAQIDAVGARCGAGANPATCRELSDTLASTDRFRSLAIAGFVGAGAGAIAAATYLLWPASSAPTSSGVRLAPVVSSQHGGIVVLGSF